MQLIGMLDSPFVRRVAIALRLLDLPYEHRPLSVFRNFEAFSLFNPMVKAPTLVLDDGTVLMDSSLILDYLECLAGRERSLLPQRPQARARALSLIGAALVACEKSVQIYYELNLRPEERRHGPWLERVEGQLLAAYDWLEAALRQAPVRRLAAPTWALRVGTGHMPGRAAIGARSAPWRQRANACAGSTDGSTAIAIFPRMPLSRLSRRAWARGMSASE
ncbi:glutathione S-transferase [Pseudomonas aeruginosa]|uniref:glutathione S-transferase family protein n=5 Tax=Pseudomonas aeruginosa TaxID=287 RepID=UPI001046806A